MKTRTIIALAATLMSAATAFTPAAEAGMGVRLGFGGPLGSFVARPSSPAAYHQPAYASPRPARGAYCAKDKKRSMALAAAKRQAAEEKAERRRELMEQAEEKAERRRKLLAAAKREKLTTKLAKAAASTVEKVETASSDNSEGEIPTSSLVAKVNSGSAPDVAPVQSVAKAVSEQAAPAAEAAPAETARSVAEAPAGEPAPAADIKPKLRARARKFVEKALDCKVFVPSAGITVSVPCKD